jgi:hypothetical protein
MAGVIPLGIGGLKNLGILWCWSNAIQTDILLANHHLFPVLYDEGLSLYSMKINGTIPDLIAVQTDQSQNIAFAKQ